MKTAEEKVAKFLAENVGEFTNKQERELIKLIKEQDRDTRHACAEAVTKCGGENELICEGDAHNACMNVKAV